MNAEVEVMLDEHQARELTDCIRGTLHTGHKLLLAAYVGKAYLALGYPESADGWASYCDTEFGDSRMLRIDPATRREIAAPMREAGMSYRAIGSAIGTDERTVRRDFTATAASAAVEQPATVTSLDGRQRPATRPTAPPPVFSGPGAASGPPRQVSEALDRFVTEDPAHRLAVWRNRFLTSLSRASDLTAWSAEDIAANCDPRIRAEHAALVDRLVAHHARATTPGPGDATVTMIRNAR